MAQKVSIPEPPSIEALQKAIEEDRQRRTAACQEAVEEALREHGCTMEARVIITGAEIASGVLIIAQ